MGLPSDNIIAEYDQRKIIGRNLVDFIDSLPVDIKQDARYLSKFVVGAGYGLFDYSLNAIWNEVVLVLRKKAVAYGIDIFFDAAVGGSKNRDFYQGEDDLPSLKDVVLLDTCRKLELIPDTTYKKLRHMLDMRNDVGISHPTDYAINAFELLGWLETCVQVLNDQPTEAALQVQAFVHNLKTKSDLIDSATKSTIEARINELPTHLCGNLLRTVFGIFVSTETDPAVRKNISLIGPAIWAACKSEPKYKLGIVLEGYKSNLHQDKYSLGAQFFEIVGGNSFRSETERSVILNEALEELYEKHNAWDNFHHETPVARKIASFVPDQASIPINVADELFKTVLMCRIGNGVNYNGGVSPGGKASYDHVLSLAGDKFAHLVVKAMRGHQLQNRLYNATCRTQARHALVEVRKNIINARLAECFDYLIDKIEADRTALNSKDFEELSAAYFA
ncbi:MAG: hypothetical protein U9R73_02030 [Pseudomonadota bacterium]|jgi:hypothetical protein|nr:hypothetical protein [Pseudomonadota bacterium]